MPNLVIAPVGADGKVSLYNSAPGTVQLIADISGYYLAGTVTAPGGFVSTGPSRLLDTRVGTGAPAAAVPAGGTIGVAVTGQAGVPGTGVSAVVLNVTVTGATAAGHITAYASGSNRPNASNLNFSAGQTVPNLVIAPVGADGKVSLYNSAPGTVQLIADISGYYLAGTVTAPGGFVSTGPPGCWTPGSGPALLPRPSRPAAPSASPSPGRPASPAPASPLSSSTSQSRAQPPAGTSPPTPPAATDPTPPT